MERYSMNNFTPLTWDEKEQRLKEKRFKMESDKEPLVDRKKEIELELSELNQQVRGLHLEDEDYAKVVKRQTEIKREKLLLEQGIMKIKRELNSVNQEIDKARLQSKKAPNDAIHQSLVDLRDKYMSFAADTTRVSSMRAMSSKFVEEIQSVLKIIKQ